MNAFDFLAFKYDRGTVLLMGYAYAPALKEDAERAVKRVPGVDTVQNKVEQLPPSRMDDDSRWRVYYAIYSDPFLSKYAPGARMLWGHRHPFDSESDRTIAEMKARMVPGTFEVKNELIVEPSNVRRS